MKKLLSVFLAGILFLSVSSCGNNATSSAADNTKIEVTNEAQNKDELTSQNDNESKANGQNLKVGFSLPSMTFPFYVRMHDQIMEEGKKRNWDITFVDGNLDAGTQLNGIQDLINNNVDVLIVATWFIDAMPDVFKQAENKNIPVFVMDNMIIPAENEKSITLTTGTDNYNAGTVGGTWYAKYLKENGKDSINLLQISAQSDQVIKRCNGFKEALEKNGINVNLLNRSDGGKRETAMAAAEDALTAFSELDVIFGSSAQDSLGAFDATMGANRKEVTIIGFDGEDEEIQRIDEKTNYLATITQSPAGQATLVAEHIDKWLNGETFEQMIETPAGVYSENGQESAADILK